LTAEKSFQNRENLLSNARFLDITKVSPKAAILEAWIELEAAIFNSI
jgi:hypothetical protein